MDIEVPIEEININEEIIEKTISSEQEFAKNRLCFEAVEKDER